MNPSDHFPFRSAAAKARYFAFNEERAKAWPVACECRTVETAQGRTFLRISGPAEAPPLLLLPGGGTHSLLWIPNIAGLSAHFRTFALDSIVDVGRSLNLVPIRSADDLIAWLHDLIEALGLGPELRLMGLSHGGWLAANYAAAHPDRVRRLVLLAPAAWVLPLRPAMLWRMTQTLLPPRRFFIRRAYRFALPDLAASGPEGDRLIETMTEELALAYECYGLRRMTKLVPPTVADDETLRTFRVPTQFVIGEHEQIYDSAQALRRLEQTAPQIERVLIRGAGHEMTWLKPREVEAAVVEFLTRAN